MITVSLEVNGEAILGMVDPQLVMNDPSHKERFSGRDCNMAGLVMLGTGYSYRPTVTGAVDRGSSGRFFFR